MAADNKNYYGMKSLLEKKRRINIARMLSETFIQKSSVDVVASRV